MEVLITWYKRWTIWSLRFCKRDTFHDIMIQVDLLEQSTVYDRRRLARAQAINPYEAAYSAVMPVSILIALNVYENIRQKFGKSMYLALLPIASSLQAKLRTFVLCWAGEASVASS